MKESDQDNLGLDEQFDDSPHLALWIVYLFFLPRTFFRQFAEKPNPTLTVVCAWLYGMCGVIDRISTRGLEGREVPFSEDWVLRWLFIGGAGVLGGLGYFFVGGWWYRVRLSWSGAHRANPNLARRVYIFAAQIVAIPTVLLTTFETIVYETPAAADGADSGLWWLLFLLFPFWAALVSTIGVWTVFEVRRSVATFWFLILPWLVYLLFFVPFLTLVFSGSSLLADADLVTTKKHESAALAFSYPGNWIIDKNDENYDPDHNVSVEPVLADAVVKILVYSSESMVGDELDKTVSAYEQSIQDMRLRETVATLGLLIGTSRSGTGKISGKIYTIDFFISSIEEGRYLEIQELVLQKQADELRKGFELIYDTLRVGE